MKTSRSLWMFALLAVIWISGCASRPGGVTVEEAWARPGAAGGNSAVYFVIDNQQGQADTLLSADCDAANVVELHSSMMDADGTMKMEHQENVPVPAGERLALEPGGLHVMLMDLTGELQPGDQLTVTLSFQNAGSVQVEAVVREP